MSFAKLDELGHRLQALEHALAILGADEATHMAVGGGEARAEAMSALAGMYHRQATEPVIADWIAAAQDERSAVICRPARFRRQYVAPACPGVRQTPDAGCMRSSNCGATAPERLDRIQPAPRASWRW